MKFCGIVIPGKEPFIRFIVQALRELLSNSVNTHCPVGFEGRI